MATGQTEGGGTADFPDAAAGFGKAAMRFPLRGFAIAIVSCALFGAAATIAGRDFVPGATAATHPRMRAAISEPVSLVLLATGLGLSARRLRRR